jgi:hypothetical protein
VASLPDDSTEQQVTSAHPLQMLVRRLLKMLPVTGRYALTISRSQGRREIMCAFENAVDALAGWSSQHTFLLDEKAEERILKTAGPGSPRRSRRAQAEE